MLVAEALDVLSIKRRPRSLILRGEIITPKDKREITVLVDIDGEEIFVSQSFVKDAQISKPEPILTMVRAINDYKIFFYEVHNLIFFLADSKGRKQK